MTPKQLEALMTRIDVVETQQAVLAGLVSKLLQIQSQQFGEPHKTSLHAIYEQVFEETISNLLASNLGFSDAAVHAVENLKKSMLTTLP
jgi:hypothetical protein